jgi:dTDP-4-amino-4,6-dideoxygalactose transaminase
VTAGNHAGAARAQVPGLELRSAYRKQKAEIDTAILGLLESGLYIGGPVLARFEENFAKYCGAAHCVGVGNGLDALHLAIRALGIGTGDEIITASNSFIATLLAITISGATPVLVEPDPQTFTIDPNRIESAITPRTRAILPTHLYGHPADLDPLLEICRRRDIRLIEDAAQAHGARYKERRIGAHGDIVCWSFYPTKNLGALGDGGAITTHDAALAENVRMLGNYGQSERYHNLVQGVNSRLDPIQAAILSVRLQNLDASNDRRRTIATRYSEGLSGTGLALPSVQPWAEHVWHQYVVLSPTRDSFQAQLHTEGVETLIHYPVPPHLQPAYAGLGLRRGTFPIAERLSEQCLSLPMWPDLTDETVEQIIQAVRSAAQKCA